MHYLAEDSDWFGWKVFQTTINTLEPEQFLTDLLTNAADLVLVRLPATRQTELHKLQAIGIPFLVAGTMVEYNLKLRGEETVTPDTGSLKFLPLHPDPESLNLETAALVTSLQGQFSEPFNGFPFRGKKQNAEPKPDFRQNPDNRVKRTWILEKDGKFAGFLTGTLQGAGNFGLGEILVLPAFAETGIWSEVIRAIPFLLKAEGHRVVKVSVGIEDVKKQQALAAAGYALSRSLLELWVYPFFHELKSGAKDYKATNTRGLAGIQEMAYVHLAEILEEQKAGLVSLKAAFLRESEQEETLTYRFSDLIFGLKDDSGMIVGAVLDNQAKPIALLQARLKNGISGPG